MSVATAPRPAPPTVSLLGPNLLALHRDRLGFLTALARRHGDVVRLALGGRSIYLLSHPDHVRAVLVTHNHAFVKGRGTQRAGLLLGKGLLISEGSFHLRQRRLAQPAFHRQRITSYGAAMVACAERAADRWHEGDTVALHAEMSRLTLDVAGATLFGTDLAREAPGIAAALDDALSYFGLAVLPGSELLDRLPLPPVRRFRRGRAALDAMIHRMIAARRGGDRARDDLLSLLLAARDTEGDGAGMSNAQLRDELMTLLVAGYETVSDALAWTWYLLGQHPDVEARLHREADLVLEGRAPVAGDVEALREHRRVFAESLRLYPTAYIAGYEAVQDVDLDGLPIPKGTFVIMSQYIVHRDPRWYPEPERFDPDRWALDDDARPPFAYFPFGGGPRKCIGEHFAWMEGILLLATIGRRWRFALLPDQRPEIWATLTLRPRPDILVRAEKRKA